VRSRGASYEMDAASIARLEACFAQIEGKV
jgi:hypothetical protein